MICLGGCYGYYPATTPAPVGRDVQVTLSDSGSFALARQVGPSTEVIDGRFASDSANSIILSVTGVRRRDGTEVDWKGEHVAVPREDIATVKERKFSVGATALLGGLTGGGLAAAIALIGGTNTTTATAGGPPGPGPQ